MQISGNQNSFHFVSAYKLATTVKSEVCAAGEAIRPTVPANDVAVDEAGENSRELHREALMLLSAHRAAGRSAYLVEGLRTL